MKERSMIVIVVGTVLCIAVIFYLNQDTRKHYDWFEDYRPGSQEPYGVAFIYKMLEGYREGKFVVNDRRPLQYILKETENPDSMDYVFIGENIFLDSESTYSLARFIEAGGNAFIASLTPPEQILSAIYFQECSAPVDFGQHIDETVNFNFLHPRLRTKEGLRYTFRVETKDTPYSWSFVKGDVFCDSTASLAALGTQNDTLVNFIRVSAGKGNLYLHSNPIVFTNYFMIDKPKVDYAAGVFSHLDGRDMIWDEFSKIPFAGENNPYRSPLYFILRQPSLKYAWWLLLFTVFMYVLFASKRKQRVVPVMEPKSNTSLEFVRLISRLHYKNGNHLDMAHKKMKYFLYFVRSKYGIHAEKFTDEVIHRLAGKSKVEVDEVRVIFSRYYLIEERFTNNIEANRLVDLCDSIDNFYNKCK